MASQSQDADGIPSGQQKPTSTWGEFNNIAFMVQQALGKMQTATLVRIDAVTNAGSVSPVGFVDVTPLVNQLDGQGNPTPHVTIHNIPYFRLQGGANAIIIDPQVGDIGICVFASRDISKIKTTKKQGNPGSWRQYSFSDGMYLGGLLNGAPTQYVQFSTAGIKIHSPVAIILEAPDIQLLADTVEIEASESVTIDTPVFTLNATASATITTPTFTVNGLTVLNGGLQQGGGSGGGDATFVGNMDITGDIALTGTLDATVDVTAAGTSLHTHRHTSTTPGTPTSTPIP